MFLSGCGDDDAEDPAPPSTGDKDDEPDTDPETAVVLTAEDFAVTIDENPAEGAVLGTIKAEVTEGAISYAITSQDVEGALAINEETGELSVLNVEPFDYEVNESISSTVTVSAEGADDVEVAIMITINNVSDVPFITTWGITADAPTLEITYYSGFPESYDYIISWGDGTAAEAYTGTATHEYSSPGNYQVKITGKFANWTIKEEHRSKLKSIDQWGDIKWLSFNRAFEGCSNVNANFTDAPDLSEVIDMSHMFSEAKSFNADLSSWDVSNVVYLNHIFYKAENFNGNLSTWDVGKVETMNYMFYNAAKFNQNIAGWDVSSVTTMSYMLYGTEVFNQNIGSWDVSNVTHMIGMLSNTYAFSQNLGSWNIESIEDMSYFLFYSGISIDDYDATLEAWSQKTVPSNIVLGAHQVKYCNIAARNILIDKGWSIEGDIQSEECN